jgi:hypothetical protein
VIEPVGLFAVLKNKITSPYGLEFPIVLIMGKRKNAERFNK